MKIAYAVTEFPLLSETFVLNQVTALLDLGHEVTVHAQLRGDTSDPVLASYELDRRVRTWGMPWSYYLRLARAPRLLRRQRREDRRSLLSAANPLRFGRAGLDLSLLYASSSFLDRSYDVVHCHFGPNGNLVAQMKELGIVRAPLVTTFHGWGLRRALKYGPDMYRALRRHGDVFIAISEYSRRQLTNLGFDPDRIVDHRMGIDLDRFPMRPERSPDCGPFRVLTVGRLVEEKAHEVGLRALKQVVERNPGRDVRYTIGGAGPRRDDLLRLAGRLGLTEHVDSPGALARDDVARAMADADVFLLPSRTEILPVVLMEAQATGLPVVATDVGAVGELVVDGVSGYLTPPNNPEAVAERLERLLAATEGERRAMGRRGRAVVEERHDIRTLSRRLERILESAAAGGTGATERSS